MRNADDEDNEFRDDEDEKEKFYLVYKS